MSKQHEKPSYNQHAVATSLGWVDSRSGELLVSHRGLEDAINLHGIARRDFVKVIKAALEKKAEKPAKTEEKASEPQVQEPTKTEEKVAEPVVEEKKAEEKAPTKKATTKKSTGKKTTTKKTTKKSTKTDKSSK